jgi:hypothetical protein
MKSLLLLAALSIGANAAESGATDNSQANVACGKGLPPCATNFFCRKLDSACIDLKNDGNCIGTCTAKSLSNLNGNVGGNGAPTQPPPKNSGGLFGGLFPNNNPAPPAQNPGYFGGPFPNNNQPPPALQPPPQPPPKNSGGLFGGLFPNNNQPPPALQPPPPKNSGGLFGGLFPNNNPAPPAQNPGLLGGLFGNNQAKGNPPTNAQSPGQPITINQCPASIRCGRGEVCVPHPGSNNAFLCVNGSEECGGWLNKKCSAGKACLADPRYTWYVTRGFEMYQLCASRLTIHSDTKGVCSGRDGVCVTPPTTPPPYNGQQQQQQQPYGPSGGSYGGPPPYNGQGGYYGPN